MTSTHLYLLFALLIVFALRLDSFQAVHPPPGYRPRCLLAVEAYWLSGLWRYDPDEEVIEGIPTMYKMEQERFSTTDMSIVYRESKIDIRLFLSWHKWAAAGHAIRFSKNRSRLDFGTKHPCRFDAAGQTLWSIWKDVIGVPREGYAQLINEIVNTQCVPEHGGVTSQLPYDLPQYDNFVSVYSCTTWLKETEVASGVDSKATAVEVNPTAAKCTVHYEDHGALSSTTSGDNEYCFLRKTFTIPQFPGFYGGCVVYVEHQTYVGEYHMYPWWKFKDVPNMRTRLYTIDDPKSAEVTKHDNWDNKLILYSKGYLYFVIYGINIYGRQIKMPYHPCIGPDTGQTGRANGSEPRIVYRHDKRLGCVPFYGGVRKLRTRFRGYKTVSLGDVHHSILTCKKYMEKEYPFGMWKVVQSVMSEGPCVSYGGGIEYKWLRLEPAPFTYSCISTNHLITIHPARHCQYGVEAGIYTGVFAVDLFWVGIYSTYPGLSRRNISSKLPKSSLPDMKYEDAQLKWEFGYRLTGLDQEYLVDLGDVNICPEEAGPKVAPVVSYTGAVIGVVYRFDADDFCDPLNVNLEPNYDYTKFSIFSGVESLKECKDLAEARPDSNGWKAFVRQGSECRAYDEDLRLNKFVPMSSGSDSYTCVSRKKNKK